METTNTSTNTKPADQPALPVCPVCPVCGTAPLFDNDSTCDRCEKRTI